MAYNNVVYRGRQGIHLNETVRDMNFGPRIDYGDGLLFRVSWGDPELIVDPTDDEWFSAEPMLQHTLPNLKWTGDDTTVAFIKTSGRTR